MNSEGIERDQWNKMGKKNYFKCRELCRDRILFH